MKILLRRIIIIIIILIMLFQFFYLLDVPDKQVIEFNKSQSFISYSNKIKICLYNDFSNASGKPIDLDISYKLINSMNKTVVSVSNFTLKDFTEYSKLIYIHPGYYTLIFNYKFINYSYNYHGDLLRELFLFRPYYVIDLFVTTSHVTMLTNSQYIYTKKL